MRRMWSRRGLGLDMPIIDARYYKTLLICPNRQFLSDLGPLLAHGLPLAQIQEVPDYPSKRQLVDLLKKFDAKVCFLDFSKGGSEADRVLEELHSVLPGIPVVGLLAGNNPDAILRCIRQGATDFLIYPFTPDQVDAAVEKIARLLPAPTTQRGGGKMIAVIPAKGASGGTTIACNLAYQSKRLGAKRILLGDLDPLSGTVSFLLKQEPSYSFMDVLGRLNQLDGDLWTQMVSPVGGIDVLLAPETPPDPATDLPTAAPILEYAMGVYQVVVADCASAFGPWNLSIARLCDELLIVSTNELASLQAVQRTLAYLEHHRVDTGKVKLIINRYIKDEGLNSDFISGAVGLEPFQIIPSDPDSVQRSLMEGKPIPANSSAGKSLATLSNRLLSFLESEKETKKAAAKGGLRSIFSR